MALAIAALIVAVLGSILAAAATQHPSPSSRVDLPYLLGTTVLQATLSTALSLGAGIALAWALNRLRFPGRGLVVGLLASAIVTPGIVVAFGLITVWGRSGWFSTASTTLFGLPMDIPLFGLGGIVAAHLILDGAFATRILLARLDALPESRLKTGQSLGLSAVQRFAIIDWPAMRGALPGLGALIFLLAFTSFPIVLLLGGGPAMQTLEVAIYAAVRLDFDLNAAVSLALVQIAICSVVILAANALKPVSLSLSQSTAPTWRDRGWIHALQWIVLLLALIGFGLPLLATLSDGAVAVLPLAQQAQFWRALGMSLSVGAASTLLAVALGFVVASARAASPRRGLRLAIGAPAYAYLAVPAVALSLGAFLMIRNLGIAPEASAPIVVVLANALLSLPFVVATLSPPLDAIARSRGKLMRALDLGGVRQFLSIEWPLIARDIGLVLALAFCFSLGDLGVIALFGTQDFTTLPLLMYRALGAYRTNDAAAISAIILALCIVSFALLPRVFERLADARA